jgi:hypothetical protein
MTNTSQHTNSNFPKLDRVIRNQRRLQVLTSVATFALFVAGALVAASSLTACASGDGDQAAVESTLEALNMGDATISDQYPDLAAFLVQAPGARYDIVDMSVGGDELHTRIEMKRADRAIAGGELVTAHDPAGHITAYRLILDRAVALQ